MCNINFLIPEEQICDLLMKAGIDCNAKFLGSSAANSKVDANLRQKKNKYVIWPGY